MDVELGKAKGGQAMAVHEEEEETVDWRGRPSDPASHGGARAAAFVLGLQAFEIMAIAAVGNNLITYVINEMHLPLAKSANVVTNFVGTIFLLSLFGGFLSDSYLGSFWTMLIFGFTELSGFILLSVQAHLPQLKPPKCDALSSGGACEEAKGIEVVIFYVALYLVALGSGCVKPNMIAHGADQFSARSGGGQSGQLSTYFNTAYFAFSAGELVALTLLVWAQTHFGMDVGFGISAAAMAVGLICLVSGAVVYRNKRPQGSIFTPIAQVIVAAISKRKQVMPSDAKMLHGSQILTSTNNSNTLIHTDRFRWLDKACIKDPTGGAAVDDNPWRLCTVNQVEKVKTLISLLPIFASTIVFNTLLAQLQTFSVQQASLMNTTVSSSSIPPASLQSIPYLLLLLLVPVYDYLFVPFARRLSAHPSGISPLQRIGSGLLVATASMAVAASVERKRRLSETLLSVFWITPQYVVFGVSEMLTAVGMIEFFYKQSMTGMQAFLTAMTYCSYSFGFYMSSVLVSMVNRITTNGSGDGWLSQNDLNEDRLDLFYWMLAGLSLVNFFNYLFWAKWFSYNPALLVVKRQRGSVGDKDDNVKSYSGNDVIT